MELKDIIDLVANNGIGIACLGVMIYSYVSTMNKITDALNSIEKSQILISERLDKIEDSIKSEG